MATYLFWILLSQNRRISDLVVQKTVDLEEANADLHEALLAKTKFVGNVSHEIRTPLNLILGMLDLLEQDRLDHKHRRYIDSMKTAGLHLLGMLEDLLDFSKADYQNLDLRIVSVNLIKLLEEVAAIAGPLARNRNLIEERFDLKSKILESEYQKIASAIFSMPSFKSKAPAYSRLEASGLDFQS